MDGSHTSLDGKRQPLERNVFALGLTSFFNDTATELAYWIVPAFLAGPLGAGPAALGWIEGLAEGTASFARLLSGWWTDRVGLRKPFVTFGYVLANAVKPLLAWAVSPVQVLAVRISDRFSKGIRSAPRDAMLAESVPAARRGSAFGFRQAMDSAGAIVGPLAAFLLLRQHVDLRTIFLFAAIPGAACVAMLFFVRETGRRKHRVPSSEFRGTRTDDRVRGADARSGALAGGRASDGGPGGALPNGRASDGSVLGNRDYVKLLIATSVFAIGNSSDLFLVLRSQQFMAMKWAPMLGLVFNASYTALAWPAGHLSDRIPRKWLLAGGYLVFAGVYAGFATMGAAWQAWLLFATYGLYYGLSEGVLKAMIADVVPPEVRGNAYGIQATLYGALVLAASLVTGYLWQRLGPTIPFALSAGCALLAAVLVISLPKPSAKRSWPLYS